MTASNLIVPLGENYDQKWNEPYSTIFTYNEGK